MGRYHVFVEKLNRHFFGVYIIDLVLILFLNTFRWLDEKCRHSQCIKVKEKNEPILYIQPWTEHEACLITPGEVN